MGLTRELARRGHNGLGRHDQRRRAGRAGRSAGASRVHGRRRRLVLSHTAAAVVPLLGADGAGPAPARARVGRRPHTLRVPLADDRRGVLVPAARRAIPGARGWLSRPRLARQAVRGSARVGRQPDQEVALSQDAWQAGPRGRGHASSDVRSGAGVGPPAGLLEGPLHSAGRRRATARRCRRPRVRKPAIPEPPGPEDRPLPREAPPDKGPRLARSSSRIVGRGEGRLLAGGRGQRRARVRGGGESPLRPARPLRENRVHGHGRGGGQVAAAQGRRRVRASVPPRELPGCGHGGDGGRHTGRGIGRGRHAPRGRRGLGRAGHDARPGRRGGRHRPAAGRPRRRGDDGQGGGGPRGREVLLGTGRDGRGGAVRRGRRATGGAARRSGPRRSRRIWRST